MKICHNRLDYDKLLTNYLSSKKQRQVTDLKMKRFAYFRHCLTSQRYHFDMLQSKEKLLN